MRHVRHFLQRRRDESGKPDDICVALARGVEDLSCRNHYAEIDHLEVVALEDDTDDILADVVHVALDGGHDDGALPLARYAGSRLLGLDIGNEMRDRLLHHPGTL